MAMQRLAKLTRPRLHGAVPRERVFGLLDQKRRHPVVWVAGPPGSGKTTAVASYVEAAGVPAIWYLLDHGDADPATFFYYLRQGVIALSRKRGRTLPLLTPEYLVDLDGFARRFMRQAFGHLPDGTIVVIDNYHELPEDSPLHGMLNAALVEIPETANLVVIGRTLPPAVFSRAKVAGALDVLGWDDLRLDETETAAIVDRNKPVANSMVEAIHSKTGGWVAGVRLLLEGEFAQADVAVLDWPETQGSAFDYFAAEVFSAASQAVQTVLLRTAFLPRFTATIATAISGQDDARKQLELMFRRRLFIDRRPGVETTYQYHDLFRAFLQNRAGQLLAEDEIAELMGRSADLLLDSGLVEDAFLLFAKARDWRQAKQLFLEQAEALIAQGRWRTFEEWGDTLPQEVVDSDPWLRYWLGRSNALVDPTQALPILETAYDKFCEQENNFGRLLCASTVVETLHFVVQHWDTMDVWLGRLKRCLETQQEPLSVDDELRIHAALFWAAENTRNPTDPVVASSVKRTCELLPRCVDPNLRVSVANILHYHSERSLDAEVSRVAQREGRVGLRSEDLSADRHALYFLSEGFAHIDFARFAEALACFDSAGEIIAAHGLMGRDHIAAVWRAMCLHCSGDPSGARQMLERADRMHALDLHVITQVSENAHAWVAFAHGETVRALEHNSSAIEIAVKQGPYVALSVLLPQRAYILIAAGQYALAAEVLERIREERELVEYEHVGGAIALLDAWKAHRSGHHEHCEEWLGESLRLAQDERTRLRMRWYPMALDEMLPVALERGIEPEVVSTFIRECNLVPPVSAGEAWPWPVKIRTLGRFEIFIAGEPVRFGRKSPRRTLALLKALISLGVTDVPEQRLADLLWPDLEGDAAHESLAAALHRMRRLLGGKEAIVQSSGQLSVNPRHCWVDVLAFEKAVEDERLESGIALYRGDFLAGDTDAPWAASTRERLRGKFIRVIEARGEMLESQSRFEDAIIEYSRGIDTDNLVEAFYRGLMRCYGRLDRAAEAASAYRRLEQTLSVTLGTRPAPQTRRLFEEIGHGQVH